MPSTAMPSCPRAAGATWRWTPGAPGPCSSSAGSTDAVALARRLVAAEDDADYYAWNARIVVARALAAQGDTEASAAYAGEEHLPDDLEYDDYDDDDLDYLHDLEAA